MNDRIRKLFEESGMSKYALAQAAGVPYTTVSEILNEKIDINRCAAESVSRMAEVLGAKTEDVLNRYHRGEPFAIVERDLCYYLQFGRGEEYVERYLCRVNPLNARYVRAMAEWEVDEIQNAKEMEAWQTSII
ncbi:MAG: helix-turn-helix transcriptional regulator [Lachnospiraceae bacterium]|nr:helix-turn-helix transcriptional regulator [Lachnospiraceae bacterium]